MNKRIITGLLLSMAIIPSIANAGFYEFTMHSRANCGGFNESISWHFKHSYLLLTHAHHFNPKATWQCDFYSADGFEMTSRAAALHFAEGFGGWYVVGNHWTSPDYGRTSILMATTDATDCAIYDGWWDAN